MKSATFFVFMHGLSWANTHLVRIALKFKYIIWKLEKAKHKKDCTVQENNSLLYTVWIVTVLGLLLRQLYLSKTGSEMGVGGREEGSPILFQSGREKESRIWIKTKRRKLHISSFLEMLSWNCYFVFFFYVTSNQHCQTTAPRLDTIPFSFCLP